MRPREHVVLAALIGCIAGGALLKGARYAAPPVLADIDTAESIARFLVDEGWQPASPLTSTSRAAYASLAFEKAGCESALSVAVLGHNAELEHLVRSDLGADIAFVQQGRVLPRPDAIGQRIELVLQAAGTLVGIRSARAMPILAVAPAPGDTAESCAPPPATDWRRLG